MWMRFYYAVVNICVWTAGMAQEDARENRPVCSGEPARRVANCSAEVSANFIVLSSIVNVIICRALFDLKKILLH